MRHALLDGDVLVYAGGFASDANAKRHGAEHEPLEYCLQTVKQKIVGVMDRAEADEYTIFLSHPVNFRESIFPEYKANRDTSHKPFWYSEIQDYLLETHKAVYSEEGDEADDAMGRAQMLALSQDRETIICTNDKDLDMIPGLHYNWSPTREAEGVYELEDPEALRKFYTQMITGDTTDNIPGLFKKRGIKATAQWKQPIEGFTNSREMYQYILDVYEGDKAFVEMIGKLLWIKRDGSFWIPPIIES